MTNIIANTNTTQNSPNAKTHDPDKQTALTKKKKKAKLRHTAYD